MKSAPIGMRAVIGTVLVALVVAVFVFPPAADAQEPAPADETRILFVGNSLTYTNDLPGMVGRIAKENKRRLKTKSISYPDFALYDHAEKGDAAKEIAKGKWNFVVMQQGASGTPENRAYLIDYTKRFAIDIRKAGGRPALYQVWPTTARAMDMDRVCESYRLAAEAVDGLLMPVGAAWKDVLATDSKIALYSEDGLHPTVAGSLLAALVMYEQVFGEAPAKLPRFDVPEAQVVILRAAASRACATVAGRAQAPAQALVIRPVTDAAAGASGGAEVRITLDGDFDCDVELDDPPPSARVSGARLLQMATERPQPVMPEAAIAARVSGNVVIEVSVDQSGNVYSARAVSGDPLLHDAAVGTALKWKFKPFTRKNGPIRVIGPLTFTFPAAKN